MEERINSSRKADSAALIGLCIALVFVSTRVLQVPIPLGYAHLGNAMILLTAVFLGPKAGALAGGLGSALADLTSFPVWTVPTLIIKTLMGWLCGRIAWSGKIQGNIRLSSPSVFFGTAIATMEMIAGYVIGGSVLYGSWTTGVLQTPGLAVEGLVGMTAFYLLGNLLARTGLAKNYGYHKGEVKRADRS
ncbi:MAG: ECF transporter S component [Lachnospiraceae bacterium]|nr:ECF transporter S component [Lachnospiraceae bacterium]